MEKTCKIVFENKKILRNDLELYATGTYKKRKLRYRTKTGREGLVHKIWENGRPIFYIKSHGKNYIIEM